MGRKSYLQQWLLILTVLYLGCSQVNDGSLHRIFFRIVDVNVWSAYNLNEHVDNVFTVNNSVNPRPENITLGNKQKIKMHDKIINLPHISWPSQYVFPPGSWDNLSWTLQGWPSLRPPKECNCRRPSLWCWVWLAGRTCDHTLLT